MGSILLSAILLFVSDKISSEQINSKVSTICFQIQHTCEHSSEVT